jgi:hypothetical protein
MGKRRADQPKESPGAYIIFIFQRGSSWDHWDSILKSLKIIID